MQVDYTPNPNSVKITLDGDRFGAKSTSVKKGDTPEDALLASLITIDGIDNLFAYGDFVTVTKEADAEWNDLLPTIEEKM
ncbi:MULTISPECIES: NifU N-terminal domain-containing protein [Exiguobacterium]|uniref:NifU N-terminal domain-containing protein n=1 Tax=Exiguobacterium TaxID=33986 RepID=UPI0004789C6D|nr:MULTISPECIES: NifU N-terminal domain-containing protein [Exiguobacterium]MCK2156496.1 NifU N-terminal domain-containing protein [Exiguobacterium sp. 17-1]MCT4793364.1 NifU N-terminal domain-containing protein [Exiguobacterium artemiae]MDW2884237.1 NifU N-terminal domain-containing protein [Exiguobacterium sibiricum]MDX1258175.1 NifU N-terminal domain-containing protein [Exiguobacterium sp. K1]QNR21864.1 scaffolding protein [Exiguobacterium sp. Helios]